MTFSIPQAQRILRKGPGMNVATFSFLQSRGGFIVDVDEDDDPEVVSCRNVLQAARGN
jgi:hypothetical protein